jgi:hypothetical protein
MKKKYGITLKYTDTAMLEVEVTEGTVLISPECCVLAGIPDHIRSNNTAMRSIMAATRKTPD